MKKQKQIRSNWMFYICAAVTASAGWLGLVNTKPVLAAESVGEEMVVGNDSSDTGDSVITLRPEAGVVTRLKMNLRSPSPSPQGLTNDDGVGVQSVDEVSDNSPLPARYQTTGECSPYDGSPYTSSNHQTEKPGCV